MMNAKRLGIAASLLATVPMLYAEAVDLELSKLFTDHMVIQRDQPVVVKGTTSADETVKVKLGDDTAETKPAPNGEWQVELPARKASHDAVELTVTDSNDTIKITDILVGDVWVCSGQSNMEWPMDKTDNFETAISEANHPNIRLYKVAKNESLTPLKNFIDTPQWQLCSPETVAKFSAVGYYFGREIQRTENVPIGLIQSAWGGTRVESWTPLDDLAPYKMISHDIEYTRKQLTKPQRSRRYENEVRGKWESAVNEKDPGLQGESAPWATADFDDSAWKTTKLPALFSTIDLEDFDGSVWFRCKVTLTEDDIKNKPALHFVADDADMAYVNGRLVGNAKGQNRQRSYDLPAEALKAGENLLTIRVTDWGGEGGIKGDTGNDICLTVTSGDSVTTKGLGDVEWRYATGVSLADLPPAPVSLHNLRPGVLYNAMIAPITDFPIAGAIWYQGESNTNAHQSSAYADMFSTMIQSWRRDWGIEFPFLYVQLASYMKIEPEPGDSLWALLRESQEKTLKLTPKTAMALAIDIGEEDDIHPRNKKDVGERLALGARAVAYGTGVEYMGPIYKSHKIEGDKVIISFDHGDELKTKNGEALKGFAIAGADGKFVWADAVIENNRVVVSKEGISNPKAVRYGWANYSLGNLYNSDDLPASPFRTDRD